MHQFSPLLLLAALTAVAPAYAQTAKPATPTEARQTLVLLPANELLGLDAHNASQKNVGSIEDVLIDSASGQIRYMVLDVGGFLGLGSTKRVVPAGLVHVTVDEKDAAKWHATTTLTEEHVKNAPEWQENEAFYVQLDRRVEAAFGKQESLSSQKASSLVRLTEMKGAEIQDASGKELGTVENLVLAPAHACVAYVVLETNEAAGERLIAVPASKIEFQRTRPGMDVQNGDENADTEDMKVVVIGKTSIQSARLAEAPRYDGRDPRRMTSLAWLEELSSYYSAEPFWKSTRAASAPKSDSTPR